MNTAANVEIDRARNEIASLVDGLKANRIQYTFAGANRSLGADFTNQRGPAHHFYLHDAARLN